MKRFFFFLVLLIAAIAAGIKIAEDPGYAYFSYGQWSIEMPLWLLIGCIFSLIFLTGFLVTLARKMASAGMQFKHRKMQRAKLRKMKYTQQGMLAFHEGNYVKAEKLLTKGIDQENAPFINYLYAAKAAFEQNDPIRAEEYLQFAKQSEPASDELIQLMHAQSEAKKHNYKEALSTLKKLPLKSKQVILNLKTLYLQLNDWPALVDLLPQCYHCLSKNEYEQLSDVVYSNFIKDANNINLDVVQHAWLQLPRQARKDTKLIALYARALIHFNDFYLAESLLRDRLKKAWDPELISLYGQLKSDKPEKLLHHAEKYLKHHPEDAALLLALGQLSIECQLWGKAKEYLTRSAKLSPTREVYIKLAELYDTLNDTAQSIRYYKQSLAA